MGWTREHSIAQYVLAVTGKRRKKNIWFFSPEIGTRKENVYNKYIESLFGQLNEENNLLTLYVDN